MIHIAGIFHWAHPTEMKHSFGIDKKQANNRLAFDLKKYQKCYKFINLAYDKKYLRRVTNKTFTFLFVLK